ncbi:hypothetical protein Tco_0502659 [Tanacetum coccineum]
MSTSKFAKTHNLVAFLEKLEESNRFKGIIDFLNASSIKYALTVNPTVYEACIQQFWATAKTKTIKGECKIQAQVYKKKVIIIEKSVRSDLMLDDAEGTECLPNDVIFEQLTLISAKTTAWNEFSSTMASAIICLATNQKFNCSKYIFDNMVKHLEGGVKFLMYLRFVQVFLDKQVEGLTRHKEVYVIPFHTKKVFANIKRPGKGFSGRFTPLFPTMMVQAPEDMGKDSAAPSDSHSIPIISQPSSYKPQKKKSRRKQRKDSGPKEPVTNEAHVSTPSYDPPQSEKVLDLEKANTAQAKEIASLKKIVKQLEKRRKLRTPGLKRLRKVGSTSRVESSDNVSLDVLEEQEKEVAEKEVSTADPVTTAGEVVTTANVEATTANAPTTTIDEPKAIGVVVQEPSEFKTTSSPLQASQLTQAKDKGKAIMVEPERPLKKKDQVALDKKMARNLEAQMQDELIEEERLARQKEEEANIALIESWDNTQAMMEADFELAQSLQAEEQGEITIEERSRLFVELMNRRKKHFAKLRAEDIRRKPPTKAQKRNQMSIYLKNIAGYKHSQLKRKSYDEIQKFGDELESDKSKKKMIDEHVEAEKDDDPEEEEMKKHMEIVQDEEEIAIDPIPLATKPPMIVKYKIVKEGQNGFYHLIRADRSSKRYSSMVRML